MAGVGDPVGTGLVASLSRPGGNVTGTTAGAAEVAGKLVELIREVMPSARRFAVLANETDPFTKPYLAEIERVARSIGLAVEPVAVRPAAPRRPPSKHDSQGAPKPSSFRAVWCARTFVDLAPQNRPPSFSTSNISPRLRRPDVVSAGADFRETAAYIDKLLKGAKPPRAGQFPAKFELIVNLKTANALGLTIAPALLTRADEVIE